MLSHHLSEQYLARLDRFRDAFPNAHAFLSRLQAEGPAQGMWLSAAVNAHLYKDEAFLAYLKIKNPDRKGSSLVVSPHFNQQIASHTTDQAARLFPKPFDSVVMKHDGFAAKWAVRLKQGDTELTVCTPVPFFDDLFDAIASTSTQKP